MSDCICKKTNCKYYGKCEDCIKHCKESSRLPNCYLSNKDFMKHTISSCICYNEVK